MLNLFIRHVDSYLPDYTTATCWETFMFIVFVSTVIRYIFHTFLVAKIVLLLLKE